MKFKVGTFVKFEDSYGYIVHKVPDNSVEWEVLGTNSRGKPTGCLYHVHALLLEVI